jgi:cell division protein FtsL
MNRLPLNQHNSPIRRERDFSALSRLGALLFLALALTGGFLFAAWQRFKAIDHGYKIEVLRHEQQQLEAERKRLELAIEKASSPAALEPVARQLGMQPVAPGQVTTRNEQPRNETNPATVVHPAPLVSR